MRFLVDAGLPPALARWLVERGAAILTKDKNFVHFRPLSKEGPPVVWVRLANTGRSKLLSRFDRVLPDVVSAVER